MEEEYGALLDDADNVVGKISKKESRSKNLLHRATAVLVFNSKGELFVHKRAATKSIYPSHYDILVGGWVRYEESYEEGAKRETTEEVGIPNPNLVKIGKYRYKSDEDNYFCMFYYCVYDGELKLQEEEVESGSFMTFDKMKEMIKKETFCPDAVYILDLFKDEIDGVLAEVTK